MQFADLYAYAQTFQAPAVPLRALAERVQAFHPHIGEVNFYPVELDTGISRGHMVYERDRSSPYDGEFTVANIRFAQSLNRCGRRFVCCKELMHVFDDADERVDSREKFVRLLKELESPKLKGDSSPMLLSESIAYWMALLVLCPSNLREQFRPDWESKKLSDYDLALKFKVPETLIKGLMGSYYDRALERLVGG